MRAVSRIDTLEAGCSFRTWLFRIAHNLSIDWWRRDGRMQTLPLPDEDTTTLPMAVESPLEQVQADEERAIVASAMGDLKDSYREALVLHQVEGHRVADVAERLNLTRSATEVLLFRARRRLREAYSRRERGAFGIAFLAGLRQLAAGLATPFAGGAATSVAGVVAVVTIGGATIGISHLERGHSGATQRSAAPIVHPIMSSHTLPAWHPHVARRAGRKHAPGVSPARRTVHRRLMVPSPSALPLARQGRQHARRLAPPAGTRAAATLHSRPLPVSSPSNPSPAVVVSSSRVAGRSAIVSSSRRSTVMPPNAGSTIVTLSGRSTFARSSSSGDGSHVRVAAMRAHGESHHASASNEGSGPAHGRADRSARRENVGIPASMSSNGSGGAKRRKSSSSSATGLPPGARRSHGRFGSTERRSSSGQPSPAAHATPAAAQASTPVPSQSRSQGHRSHSHGSNAPALPTADPPPAAAESASSSPRGSPPGQTNRLDSRGQPPAPAVPPAPALTVSASAGPVAPSGGSDCPPKARGGGCDHKP
jgi:RNA polymerase sigma-70 factor (ECF subfamily)